MRLRRASREVEIPTSSMADIAFLLIVFFMLTTVFAETMGINFKVPPLDREEQTDETEDAIHLALRAGGAVLVDGSPMDRARLVDQLGPYMLDKLKSWPEKPILIEADKDAPYGAFVEVYDVVRQVERAVWAEGWLHPSQPLKLSVLSLKDVDALKARFGEDIFQRR